MRLRWCLTAVVCTLVLAACTRAVYTPVESVRTEYKDREVKHTVADTVRDTRVVWIKGDTVVDVRDRERIRSVEIHDTCIIERTDSVPVPYPVERKLSRWEQAKMDFGGAAIGAVLMWLIFLYLKRKF